MSDSIDDEDRAETERTDIGREIATESDELGTMLGHFYRAEMDRTNTWRQRSDESTKWTVTIIAAVLVYGFSANGTPAVLLAGIVVTTIFLTVESRRYQVYDIWRSRVRLLQENYFANALDPSAGIEHDDWRRQLSDDLREQTIKISYFEAFKRRLSRVYFPLLLLLLFAWLFRITVFESEGTVLETAAVGEAPGIAIIGLVALFYSTILAIRFWPHERRAMGRRRGKDPGEWTKGKSE